MLDFLPRCRKQIDFDSLHTEAWMFRGEPQSARLFACANPDGARSADERKRVVANQLSGTFQRKGDGIVRVGADGAELVGDAQDDAGGVGSVCVQFVV